MSTFEKAAAYGRQISNFLRELDSTEGTEKISSDFSNYTREKIREETFLPKILPAETLTIDSPGIQRSTDYQDDSLYYLHHLEPSIKQSTSMFYTFQGTGESEYIYGRKVLAKISSIGTRKYEKSEDELEVYQGFSLLELVQDTAIKELGKFQDSIWMNLSRAAIKVNGLDVDSGGVGINKNNLIDLHNALIGKDLIGSITLMTRTTYNNFFKQDVAVFGEVVASEIFKNGFAYDSIYGYPILQTLKRDLIDDNEVFCYAAPEYLGKFFVYQDTKFVVKKDDGIVSWYAKKKIAILLANLNAVARLKLNGFTD